MADASMLMILLRLTGAVVVVVALLLLASRVTRRMHGQTAGADHIALTVVARQPLGRSASVAVVQAGGRTLILGVTDNKITLLSEQVNGSDTTIDEAPRTASRGELRPSPPRTNFVETLRERTVRRT